MSKGPKPVPAVELVDVAGKSARFADGRNVSFDALSRPELSKVFKYRFPEADGRVLIGRSNAAIVAAISDAIPDDWKVEHQAEPVKFDGNAAEALAQAVKALAAQVAPQAASVDEDRVRELVAEAVAGLGKQVQTIVVRDKVEYQLPDGEYVRPELQTVVDLLSQGMHVMLVGPAGSGKSHFAEQVAKALGLEYSSNSCSAGMSESALSGWLLPVGESGKFAYVPAEFVKRYEEGGLHLIDEIDAADPNLLVFINQALANGHFFLPHRHEKTRVDRHPNFRCIAAANTYGSGADRIYVGREQLDAATLDRFWIIDFGYDAILEERAVLPEVIEWANGLRNKVNELRIRRVVSSRKLIQISTMIRSGWKFKQCKDLFFTPWTAEERSKVGA